MATPITKANYKSPELTQSEIIEKREIGKKIYEEIDATKGLSVNYYSSKCIDYTWDDFTNLVLYEKKNDLPHHYSTMISVNLMKTPVYKKPPDPKDTGGQTGNLLYKYYTTHWKNVNDTMPI